MKSALGRNRTCDQEIRRLLLYPLSYEGNAYKLGVTEFTPQAHTGLAKRS